MLSPPSTALYFSGSLNNILIGQSKALADCSVPSYIPKLDVSKRQVLRVIGLLCGMVICMIIFYKNQKNRPYRRTFQDLFYEFNINSARNRWYIKLTFIVSSAMLVMNLLNMPRAMWIGIACMSVCLPFSKDIEGRAGKRGAFNIVGCLIFSIMYIVLPKSMYPYIGMIGGIGVGYSAGYSWQTVFNTFGALSIAAELFGLKYAVLRCV